MSALRELLKTKLMLSNARIGKRAWHSGAKHY